jgi:hypothetical protein
LVLTLAGFAGGVGGEPDFCLRFRRLGFVGKGLPTYGVTRIHLPCAKLEFEIFYRSQFYRNGVIG